MRRLLAAAASAALLWPQLSAASVPVPAAMPAQPQTLRLARGAEIWTIPYAALQQFVERGSFSDQRLLDLVANSGWPDADLRTALAKPYAVDVAALARFLYSPAGVAFLQQQTRAYRPVRLAPGRADLRVEGLRAAILRSAASGTISALAILRDLPTAYVFELGGDPIQRCSALPCDNPLQCRSILSVWVFLPACLQAASDPASAGERSGGALP